VFRRARIDPLGRQAAVALGAGRIAIGVGTLLATRQALKPLGFGDTDAKGVALARLAGGRDLALGALTIASRDDAPRLRALLLAGAALDSADAFTLGLAAAEPETRAGGFGGALSGLAAAALGCWAYRRLS
jgi:hypothetical protein